MIYFEKVKLTYLEIKSSKINFDYLFKSIIIKYIIKTLSISNFNFQFLYI